MGRDAMTLVFLIFNFKPAFSLISFTLIKRFFHSSSFSAFRVAEGYLRLLMFLPPILIPAYNSCSLAFLMICSAYRLNKQGDNRQPCHSPFSILNQSVVPYRVLTVASWPAYRFLRKQVRWSDIPISLISTYIKGFSIVNETKVDVFLKFPYFLCDPVNVGNLISGSSSFSKSSLDLWNFLVCIMLKPGIQDFKHDLTSMGDE